MGSSGFFRVHKGLNLGVQGVDPAGAAEGDFYTSSGGNIRVYVGGAWRDAVFADKSQTFTNKTISAANNTITTAPSGNLTATDLNTALSELQTDVDTRATEAALTTHTSSTANPHSVTAAQVGAPTTADFTGHTGATSAHGVTGDIVGTGGAQTIAGVKTFDSQIVLSEMVEPAAPAAGKQALFIDSADSKPKRKDSAGVVRALGSGSASGGVNYVGEDNRDAESGAHTLLAYTGGGATPTSTTGATGTAASRTNTDPLSGTQSFLFTPSAAGAGVSIPVTIDRAALAQMQTISMDLEIGTPASYTDGDIQIWVVDVTGAVVIQPAPFKVLRAIGPQKIHCEFQTSSTSLSYRVLVHQATAATGYTVKFDNISVGPEKKVNGTPVTDWQSFTPSFTNVTLGTGSTVTAFKRRVGDTEHVVGRIALGTGGDVTGNFLFNPPSTVDSAKINSNNTSGVFRAVDVSTGIRYSGSVFINTSGVYFQPDGVAAVTNATVPFDWADSDVLEFEISYPVQGWSSSTVLSSDASTRVVAARVYLSAASLSLTDNSTVTFNTVDHDSHGGYSTSTGAYTVPVSGIYRISSKLIYDLVATGTQRSVGLNIVDSGTTYTPGLDTRASSSSYYVLPTGTTTWTLKAGDTISVRANHDVGAATNIMGGGRGSSFLDIERISGPSQISSSETVVESRSAGASITLPNDTYVAVDYTNTEDSTHGGWIAGAGYNSTNGTYTTTPKWVAPVSGRYRISATLLLTSTTAWADGEVAEMRLITTASGVWFLDRKDTNGSAAGVYIQLQGTKIVKLKAGDSIYIDVKQQTGAALNTFNNKELTYLDIERIGN